MEDIKTDRTIDGSNFEELKRIRLEEESRQRSDIQYWVDGFREDHIQRTWKFYLIEIAIPFGKESKEEERLNTWRGEITAPDLCV
jgi:hypothetical protein